MKLNCIEIIINDEELGCQVFFSNKKNLGKDVANINVRGIIDSIEEYLLIQKSYSYNENDYIYFETHNEEYAGELKDYKMVLTKERFKLKLQNREIEVLINPTNKKYLKLKKILPILTNKSGKLNIHN